MDGGGLTCNRYPAHSLTAENLRRLPAIDSNKDPITHDLSELKECCWTNCYGQAAHTGKLYSKYL